MKNNKIYKNIKHVIKGIEYLEYILDKEADCYYDDSDMYEIYNTLKDTMTDCITKIEDDFERFKRKLVEIEKYNGQFFEELAYQLMPELKKIKFYNPVEIEEDDLTGYDIKRYTFGHRFIYGGCVAGVGFDVYDYWGLIIGYNIAESKFIFKLDCEYPTYLVEHKFATIEELKHYISKNYKKIFEDIDEEVMYE